MIEFDFEDGKKEGKEIGFYENGKTEYENYFKDGKKEDKSIFCRVELLLAWTEVKFRRWITK